MTAHDSDAPGTLPAQAGETPPRRVCDAAAGGFRGSTSTSPSGTQDSRSSSRRLAGLCAGAETPGPPASCGEFDLDDLTLDEARVRLRDTLNLLKQKDNDLHLAGELGSRLLGQIETLSNDRDKLLSRLTAAAAPPPGFHAFEAEDASFSSGLDLTVTSLPAHVAARETANKERCEELETKVDDLERSNADLAARLAHAAQQRHELEKSTEKKLAEMREDLESAKSAVEAEAQRAQEAEEEKKRLAKEKAALLKDRKSAATADAEIERLVRNVDDLETSVQELTIAKKELDERLCAERSSRKDLELRCSDYQEQLDELRHLKNDYEAQSAQLNEVNLALEDSRATANALQAVLDKLSPRSESGPDPGGKTLFSEVEDRRAELESKHHSLSQRHVGLIKAHSMTVHQQERLKNHISRLSQLTNSRSNENKLQRLEQALGQSQSENQRLLARVRQLERAQEIANFAVAGQPAASGQAGGRDADPSATAIIDCLKLQVDQLSGEAEQARRELRTLNMLRLEESEKMRRYEAALQERESEVEELRTANAHICYELDEIRLQQRTNEDVKQEDEALLARAVVDVRHRATQTPAPPQRESRAAQTAALLLENSASQTDPPGQQAPCRQQCATDDPFFVADRREARRSADDGEDPEVKIPTSPLPQQQAHAVGRCTNDLGNAAHGEGWNSEVDVSMDVGDSDEDLYVYEDRGELKENKGSPDGTPLPLPPPPIRGGSPHPRKFGSGSSHPRKLLVRSASPSGAASRRPPPPPLPGPAEPNAAGTTDQPVKQKPKQLYIRREDVRNNCNQQ